MKKFNKKAETDTFKLIITLVLTLAAIIVIWLIIRKILAGTLWGNMNKKALQSTLKNLLIILIIAIILFGFAKELSDGLIKQTNKEICKLSVLKKAQFKILKAGMESDSPLECHTNYIDITEKGIYISDNKKDKDLDVKFKGKTKEESNEVIKRYLANQLYDCWYQFGEGKIDFLGEIDFGKSNVRCFPCANIRFEEPFLNSFTYSDWEKYLDETDTPLGKSSYKKFLNYKDTGVYSDEYKGKPLNTEAGGYMSIYFIAEKRQSEKASDLSRIIFFASPVTSWIISGVKTEIISTAIMIDPEYLTGICSSLY